MIRPAAVLAALLILGACAPAKTDGGKSADKFAGLDAEILKWRTDIIATDKLCKSTEADKKCQSFEVACKAERELTAEDRSKGVTAHVVAAMVWEGWDPALRQVQSGARTVQFSKAAAGWTRADHAPVNTSSCADL